MMNPPGSIRVKANIVLDAIDPRIYGQNIEHMGRQVRLYRQLSGKARVFSDAECPAVGTPKLLNLPQRRAVPLLDVSASLDEQRLTVFVINRDHQENLDAEIAVSDFNFAQLVRVHTVAANGYQAANSNDQPEMVTERISEVEWNGHCVFPPCSVTAIVMEKAS